MESRAVGCVSGRLTYWDEVGRLAVFQLDPQPVKVLVASPHAVLWEVKLYPCRLKKTYTHIPCVTWKDTVFIYITY